MGTHTYCCTSMLSRAGHGFQGLLCTNKVSSVRPALRLSPMIVIRFELLCELGVVVGSIALHEASVSPRLRLWRAARDFTLKQKFDWGFSHLRIVAIAAVSEHAVHCALFSPVIFLPPIHPGANSEYGIWHVAVFVYPIPVRMTRRCSGTL